jgi:hypothetical protein
MFAEQLPLLVVGGVALLALLIGLRQLQVARRLRSELEQLRSRLEQPEAAEAAVPISFSTNLETAEREQLRTTQPAMPRNSAEKYRYVGSLAQQGLDAKGIAEALQMPVAEVEQLMQLAKLKQAPGAK